MSDKTKNLNEALSQIEKQFGKGAVMKMGDRENTDIPSVSTGSLGLDIALGIGGLPKGRVIEIFGPESSGKTTLTLQAIAECQKEGGTAAFIDAEHALDPSYAEKLGVNVDENLLMGVYIKDKTDESYEEAERIFEKYERLRNRRNQQAKVLSGGERRLLEISRDRKSVV